MSLRSREACYDDEGFARGLILGLAVCSYWAQEKQGSKQDQRSGVSSAANAAQSPDTYNISSEDKERKNPVRFTDLSVEPSVSVWITTSFL